MILVAMRNDVSAKFFQSLFDVPWVGRQSLDAQIVIRWKSNPAIDEDQVTRGLVDNRIRAYLIKAAQWEDAQCRTHNCEIILCLVLSKSLFILG